MPRILAIGDIHLGRRPARLPDGLDPRELTPAAAWYGAVEAAIARGVDAVALAGDVVEHPEDLYEAWSDLERGIQRLAEAGIPAVAVSGNHDTTVLPRLADALPDLRLLGRDGQWEEMDLGGARLLGWSFPAPAHPRSPLADGLPPRNGPEPRLGLLHCDRDQTDSRYAPVRSTELAGAEVDAWLLGHIHAPDDLAGPRPMGYLGSLMGLDPGEPGAHGPWLVTADGEGVRAEQLPLAPLRWESVAVDLTPLTALDELDTAIAAAIDARHQQLAEAGYLPRAVGCRLRLTGRSDLRRTVADHLASADLRRLQIERDGCTWFVEAWRLEARPALDLAELAASSDPAGLLARRLLVLGRGANDPERRALLARAREELLPRMARAPFDDPDAPEMDEAALADTLERAALEALDRLLAQVEDQPTGIGGGARA